MSENYSYIPSRLKNAAVGGHVAGTEDILDEELNKPQSQVNSETNAKFSQMDDEIEALEKQDVVPVDSLPAVGSADPKKIYRVVGSTSYTDYMVNAAGDGWKELAAFTFPGTDSFPEKDSLNIVTSGGIFNNLGALDISELNATENPHTLATYADLSAALAAIPSDYQKGGMSIKFVSSSDNKYVQARCMAQNFTTDVTQWQGVDDEPTAGSDNLVKSGGVYSSYNEDSYLIKSSDVRGVGGYSPSDGSWASGATAFWSTNILPFDSVGTIDFSNSEIPSYVFFWGASDNFLGRKEGATTVETIIGATKVAFTYPRFDSGIPVDDVVNTYVLGLYTNRFEIISEKFSVINGKIAGINSEIQKKANRSDACVNISIFSFGLIRGIGAYGSSDGAWNSSATSFWSTYQIGCENTIQLGYAPAWIYFWKDDGTFIERIAGSTSEITVPNGAYKTAFVYNRFVSAMPQEDVIGTSLSGINESVSLIINKPADAGMFYFTVEVNGIIDFADIKNENYVHDYCAVRIPASYRSVGKPHRLIIVNHGAGGQVTSSSVTRISDTNNTFGYLSSLGYVMLEVNGLPDELWKDWMKPFDHKEKGESMAGPITMRCIEKAYQYVIEHYNVYDDGCFIYGASMGGLVTNNVLNNTNIPVLAVALDAPVIDVYLDGWNSKWFSNVEECGTMSFLYGFRNFRVIDNTTPQFSIDNGDTWNNFGGATQDKLNIYYYQNSEKVIAYNPPYNKRFSVNPDADISGITLPQQPSIGDSGVEDGVTTFDYLRYSVFYKAPLKIWHGVEDPTNQHRLSVNFIKLVQNGGQYAEMRNCPTSTHGVITEIPTGEAVVKGDYTISPYGYEMCLWFANHGGEKCI